MAAKRLLIVLNYHDGDIEETNELLRLFIDLQGGDRDPVADLLLWRRYDSQPIAKDLILRLHAVFENVSQMPCRRRLTGHPGGPNEMFYDLVNRVAMPDLRSKYEVFLNLEPDCVPLNPGWTSELLELWNDARDRSQNVLVSGFYQPDHQKPHINGVALYSTSFAIETSLLGGPPHVAYDIHCADIYSNRWVDDGIFYLQYSRRNITLEELYQVRRDMRTPIIFHGVKDESAVRAVRKRHSLPDMQRTAEPARTFVQLGRLGDIINILPALQQEGEITGKRPRLVVARPFASLLDGVSYLDPVIFDGPVNDLKRAAAGQEQGSRVCVTQVTGNATGTNPPAWSFLRCSRAKARVGLEWNRRPEFDRRDKEREDALLFSLGIEPATEFVAVSTSGFSSPFSDAKRLLEGVAAACPENVRVVDLTRVRADRFYDLLAVIERAKLLVTIDTAHLHLAAATSTPVAALLADGPTPWHRSFWRPEHLVRMPYKAFSQHPEKFFDPISAFLRGEKKTTVLRHLIFGYPEATGDTRRRIQLAEETWENEYRNQGAFLRWEKCNVLLDTLSRDATSVGDPRPMPFIRDMVETGLKGLPPEGYLVFTNTDICPTPGVTGMLVDSMSSGSAYAFRWDFGKLAQPWRSEEDIIRGKWYPGSDLFAFTPAWWARYGQHFPDMILGRETWDLVMRNLMRMSGGIEIHSAIYHEWHESFWEQPEARATNGGNAHNRKLCEDFMRKFRAAGARADDWQQERRV